MYKEFTRDEILSYENQVDKFFEAKQIKLEPKIDIIKVCKKLGFRMVSLDLPFGIDGIVKVKNGIKIIGINNRTNPNLSRFVVGHELAHYIVALKGNYDNDNKVLFGMRDSILHDGEKSDEENEMDYISAAILVPRQFFQRDLLSLGIGKVTSLSEAEKVDSEKLDILSDRYDVDKGLICRRIFEVSIYGEQ